jgi:exodeoxyribonuclease VII large subunit
MDNYIFSVTALNNYIKELMDSDPGLAAVTVRGEISNYKAYPSGHHYFSLKDESGALKCVMFKGNAIHLRFRPQNGMRVVAMGRVSVFPRDGAYQLYVTAMMPDGVGDLHMAFEQLKEKLQGEGLFAQEHKKPLPVYPEKIALITSPVGAAVRDMIRILGARWPMAEVCVLPVRVQGAEAAGEIARAIAYANACQVADLLIVGRGGGSMEDLWCFNEEIVARAIYASELPVISAVGHEPDVTISDLVADVRAATPSNAAELAVADQNDVYAWVQELSQRLGQQMARELRRERERLDCLQNSRALQDPMWLIEERRMWLDRSREQMGAALRHCVAQERTRFAAAAGKLDALSPLKVLGRGYAIPKRGETVITSVKSLKAKDEFVLQLRDGAVDCQVKG